MTTKSGLGINYGHQYTSANYNSSQVTIDFAYLYSIGIRKIRIAYPNYNDSSMIVCCKDMVSKALAQGFTKVLWGVVAPPNFNLTTWNEVKTYVTGTLAPWAQSLNNSAFCLSMGNESELHCDGSTITVATVEADNLTQAATVQGIYTVGTVGCDVNALQIADYSVLDISALDCLGINCYDTISSFTGFIKTINTAFKGKAIISEFGCKTLGNSDYATENDWYVDLFTRIQILQQYSIPEMYLFTYKDGGFGLTADTYGFMTSSGIYRKSWNAIFNGRQTFTT